jgi:hypothetical protein
VVSKLFDVLNVVATIKGGAVVTDKLTARTSR